MAVAMEKVRAAMMAELSNVESELDKSIEVAIRRYPFDNPLPVYIGDIPWSHILTLWPRYEKEGWVKAERNGATGIFMTHNVSLKDLISAMSPKDMTNRSIKLD